MLKPPFFRARAENRCTFVRQVCSVTAATAVLLLLGLTPGRAGTARAKTPAVFAPASDFVLKSAAGRNLRLSEFRGEVVVVNFWSAHCGGCRNQLDQLAAIDESNRPHRMSILSVNIDGDSNAARRAIKKQDLKFPVLLDTDRQVSRLYAPERLPMTIMVDPHGIVRYIHEGYKRSDEALFARELAELIAE